METENLNNNEKISIAGELYTLDEIKADKILLRKYKKKLYQKQYINNYMKEYNKKQKEKDIDGYRAKLNESKKKKYATNEEFRKKVLQKAKEYSAKKRGKTIEETKKYRKFYMSDDGDYIEIIE
jgi:hypothetical protein